MSDKHRPTTSDNVGPGIPTSHRDRVEQLQKYVDDARRETLVARAELRAVRGEVETTMHDFAHSAEVALCEDPPGAEYASAMETACVRLRAILEEAGQQE